MTPAQYLRDIVMPTVAEFEAKPADVRRAMLACTICYHTVDAIARDRRIKDEKVVYDELVGRCPEMATLKAVSLMTKHVAPNQQGFEGTSIDDVKVGRGAAFSDGSYYSDGASHSDAPARAVMDSPVLRKVELLRDIRACVAFLSTEVGLQRCG